MNSGVESVAMSYQDVLLGIKKQRTRVTLRYRIVPITAAYKLLGSTKLVYCNLAVKVKEKFRLCQNFALCFKRPVLPIPTLRAIAIIWI
jgi:hypothetical protein